MNECVREQEPRLLFCSVEVTLKVGAYCRNRLVKVEFGNQIEFLHCTWKHFLSLHVVYFFFSY